MEPVDELKEKLPGEYRDDSGRVSEEPGSISEEPGRVSDEPGRFDEQPGGFDEQPGGFDEKLWRVVREEPGWSDDDEPERADGDAAEDRAEVCS